MHVSCKGIREHAARACATHFVFEPRWVLPALLLAQKLAVRARWTARHASLCTPRYIELGARVRWQRGTGPTDRVEVRRRERIPAQNVADPQDHRGPLASRATEQPAVQPDAQPAVHQFDFPVERRAQQRSSPLTSSLTNSLRDQPVSLSRSPGES